MKDVNVQVVPPFQGLCSVSYTHLDVYKRQVYKFIQQFYSNLDYYIPDRYNEGYGISKKGVDYAAETGGGLIIVLDCGDVYKR